MKYIVYITTNLCNGKLYVGVHKTDPKIFDGYIGCGIYRPQQATRDYTLHKAVRKYGYENFRRTTIQEFPDTEEGKKEAYALEAAIVTETFIKSKNVYNSALGGRESLLESSMMKVYQFTLDGNFVQSYKCALDAARAIGEESGKLSIAECCRGRIQTAYGYFWSYEKKFTYEKESIDSIKRRKLPVAQYSIQGKFIRYFANSTEATAETGIVNITGAIRSEGSNGGYQWRWYNNDNSDIEPLVNCVTKYRSYAIEMYDKDDVLLNCYESIKQCIELNPNLKSRGISRVLKGETKSHMGYKFKWKDKDIV